MESSKRPGDRRPIGEIFVERGHVTDEDLVAALEHQRDVGGMLLGEILVERGLISRLVLASVLSEQWEGHERRAKDRRSQLLPDGEVGHGDAGAENAAHDDAVAPAPGSMDVAAAAAELRKNVAAAREASSSEVLGLAAMLDKRLRAVVDELGGRLDTLAAASHAGSGGELEAKLDGLAVRLTGPLGIGGVQQTIEEIRARLDLGPELEAFAIRVESSLASRVEELGAGHVSEPAAVDFTGIYDAIARLHSELAERSDLVDFVTELRPALERLAAGTPFPDELERLDGLNGWGDERITAFAAANGGALRAELATLESRLVDPIVVRLDALGNRLSALELATGPSEAGEEIAGVLARLGQRFDGLEHRLSDGTPPGDVLHHIAALRDELAARDERLESIDGFTRKLEARVAEGLAGATECEERAMHELRQALGSLQHTVEQALQPAPVDASDTIEELQNTIDELHARLAQAEPVADEPQQAVETSHIAFVPVQAGYALVEREGSAPPVGSQLTLPSVDVPFVVLRIGRSPLPLDRRRCAYLEPLRA